MAALTPSDRPPPGWRWTRPSALLPLLGGVVLASLVLQLALRCCS
jgi:hypothetical protein